MSRFPLDELTAHRAMADGLNSHFKASLKDLFSESAKTIIDQAVEDGMKSFETTLNHYLDVENYKRVVEIVLKDARSALPPKITGGE